MNRFMKLTAGFMAVTGLAAGYIDFETGNEISGFAFDMATKETATVTIVAQKLAVVLAPCTRVKTYEGNGVVDQMNRDSHEAFETDQKINANVYEGIKRGQPFAALAYQKVCGTRMLDSKDNVHHEITVRYNNGVTETLSVGGNVISLVSGDSREKAVIGDVCDIIIGGIKFPGIERHVAYSPRYGLLCRAPG